MASVARYFGVPRTTLAHAISKTEREIARTPETRGRPPALSGREVPCADHWGDIDLQHSDGTPRKVLQYLHATTWLRISANFEAWSAFR